MGKKSIREDAEGNIDAAAMLRNMLMLMLFMPEVGIFYQCIMVNGMVLVRVVRARLLASPLVDLDLLLMVYLSNSRHYSPDSLESTDSPELPY